MLKACYTESWQIYSFLVSRAGIMHNFTQFSSTIAWQPLKVHKSSWISSQKDSHKLRQAEKFNRTRLDSEMLEESFFWYLDDELSNKYQIPWRVEFSRRFFCKKNCKVAADDIYLVNATKLWRKHWHKFPTTMGGNYFNSFAKMKKMFLTCTWLLAQNLTQFINNSLVLMWF